jgi:hypothetical protein
MTEAADTAEDGSTAAVGPAAFAGSGGAAALVEDARNKAPPTSTIFISRNTPVIAADFASAAAVKSFGNLGQMPATLQSVARFSRLRWLTDPGGSKIKEWGLERLPVTLNHAVFFVMPLNK